MAVAFILISVVMDESRPWSGITWIIVADIVIALMLRGKEPGNELRALITVLIFLASAQYNVVRCKKEKHSRS